MLWQFRRELIGELLKQGEVVISMPFVGHEDDFKALGCRCINTEVNRRGINPVTDFKLYLTYRRLLKTEKPDMVITYSIKPNIYAGFACRMMGIPYCVNVQGLGTAFQNKTVAKIVTAMYQTALKNAKTVFFENQENADEFIRRKIVASEQKTVLNGAGVNLDFHSFQPYPQEDDGIHFLFLGRIMKEKGVDELFSAARSLKEKYGNQIIFDLVGFFEDEYKAEVDMLEKSGTVNFHGFQSDPRPFYAKAHCVVMPSYHEGMSNVLLEAAATGRAVITTDIPGCREAVDDGISGLLCRKKDTKDLMDKMEAFINTDMESRKNMGIAGRKRMEKIFDKQNVVSDALKAVFQ